MTLPEQSSTPAGARVRIIQGNAPIPVPGWLVGQEGRYTGPSVAGFLHVEVDGQIGMFSFRPDELVVIG